MKLLKNIIIGMLIMISAPAFASDDEFWKFNKIRDDLTVLNSITDSVYVTDINQLKSRFDHGNILHLPLDSITEEFVALFSKMDMPQHSYMAGYIHKLSAEDVSKLEIDSTQTEQISKEIMLSYKEIMDSQLTHESGQGFLGMFVVISVVILAFAAFAHVIGGI